MQEVPHHKEDKTMGLDEFSVNTMHPPPQPSSQRSAPKETRDCPQTPVGRLPLAELLSNGEDNQYYRDLTPTERVLWDNSPLSTATPSLSQKSRKRKRAHSSSPVPSQKRSSKHVADGNLLNDVPALRENLRTPKADLVDDLWNRYSLHRSGDRSPTIPFHADFPKLIHSSSPAPDLPNRESTGLRRAFSCIDWPTSAAKRRRLRITNSQLRITNSQLGQVAGLVESDKPRDSIEKTKSRVRLLLERIHDQYAKPSVLQDFSSSDPGSSPAASKKKDSSTRQPPEDKACEVQVNNVANILSQAGMSEPRSKLQPLTLPAGEIGQMDRAEEMSDFDDDDLDMEMIEALAGSANETNAQTDGKPCRGLITSHTSQASSPSTSVRYLTDKLNTPARLTHMKSSTELAKHSPRSVIAQQQGDEFDDESDDDENEVTAAELEGVFAKYDRQMPPHLVPETTKFADGGGMPNSRWSSSDAHVSLDKQTVVTIEVPSDEEDDFGGDSDFDQIAAEVAVSQDQQDRSQVKASVCNLHRPPTCLR